MLKCLVWWWRQPDHYVWCSDYLRARGTASMVRAMLALAAATLALIYVALLWSSIPQEGAVRPVLSFLSVAGATACALLWVVRWPRRSESIAFAITGNASIAMASLAQSDPAVALVACTAFAMISGYIAVFHTAPFMAANMFLVAVIPVVPVLALIPTYGVVRPLCGYGLLLVVNIALAFGIQILVRTLGADVLNADSDPLTGLLNRRAFYERFSRLVLAHGHSEAHLVVAMIDLDRFKKLNDTEGHAAGDRVLMAVGRVLQENSRPTAVVGRVGGEEFLVADVYIDPRQAALGQRLCDAMVTLPHAVTASIGIASARCDQLRERRDPNVLITALIASADGAMYDAKRNGGNQFRQRVGPLDELLPLRTACGASSSSAYVAEGLGQGELARSIVGHPAESELEHRGYMFGWQRGRRFGLGAGERGRGAAKTIRFDHVVPGGVLDDGEGNLEHCERVVVPPVTAQVAFANALQPGGQDNLAGGVDSGP